MILQSQNNEIVDGDYLFGYSVIDDKIKYSIKILNKFEQISKLENYSDTTDLFFMITHLQAKYLYDIDIRFKRHKRKSILNQKESYKKLNNILKELQKNHSCQEKESFELIQTLFRGWVNEQHGIDTELAILLKLNN